MFSKIAILTSKDSWFVPYAMQLIKLIRKNRYEAKLFFKHENIPSAYDLVFMLSYFRVVGKDHLKKHKHNIVVHESDLPRGKGWAPLSWQVLEGKNRIPVVLFEATRKMDAGPIYIKDHIKFKGTELYTELRAAQAAKTMELCFRFIREHKRLRSKTQSGRATFYGKRDPGDSELSIRGSIKDQFNLLRVVDNENFPAFFFYKGHKYTLRILKDSKGAKNG
jgi:methionyl-tRNA formyltransferase